MLWHHSAHALALFGTIRTPQPNHARRLIDFVLHNQFYPPAPSPPCSVVSSGCRLACLFGRPKKYGISGGRSIPRSRVKTFGLLSSRYHTTHGSMGNEYSRNAAQQELIRVTWLIAFDQSLHSVSNSDNMGIRVTD